MKVTKKIAGATAAVALSLGALAGSASAAENKLGYSWTVMGESDYMFRGITYNAEDANAVSYLEFTYNMFYLGVANANMDYGGALGPWETDVLFGIRTATGPVNWDIGLVYYLYGNPGEPGDLLADGSPFTQTSIWNTDYVEFKIGATYSPITNLTVGANLWLTHDQAYGSTENVSYEGTLSYTLPQIAMFTPTFSALLGHSESGTNDYYTTGYWLGDDSYTYWNAGVKLAVDKFFLDLRYWDTDLDPNSGIDAATDRLYGDWSDSRFVFQAGVTLP